MSNTPNTKFFTVVVDTSDMSAPELEALTKHPKLVAQSWGHAIEDAARQRDLRIATEQRLGSELEGLRTESNVLRAVAQPSPDVVLVSAARATLEQRRIEAERQRSRLGFFQTLRPFTKK